MVIKRNILKLYYTLHIFPRQFCIRIKKQKLKLFLSITTVIISILNCAAQLESKCFDANRIMYVRYEPSGKSRLKKSNVKKIVFRVDPTRKGITLKNRYLKRFYSDTDSLTLNDSIKINHCVKRYYISYFANYTDSIISIPTIIGRITLIQEAVDQNGIWRPIEISDNYLQCGNTDHGNISLQPGEFIEIYPRKYCGNIKTKLRMKILTDKGIVISEEYEGFVNPSQFDLNKITYKYRRFINATISEEKLRVEQLLKKKEN